MVYRVIGLMSGSSLDGLDIAFTEFQEMSGRWTYKIRNASCYPYDPVWIHKLKTPGTLNALEYLLLHTSYGNYLGQQVNRFIDENHLHYQVQLVVSHGHTAFHVPSHKMTAQLGDGAAIAAVTGINTVTDLRSLDIALGGQGAPIVPIGEKLMLNNYHLFLNIGGIANISFTGDEKSIAFDVCPANRVLNLLAIEAGKTYDDEGQIAEKGTVNNYLLNLLNELEYYQLPYPKSLSNDFGTDVVFPLIMQGNYGIAVALRTYVEHICQQVSKALVVLNSLYIQPGWNRKLLVTGGGAHNTFLIGQMRKALYSQQVEVIVPDKELVDFKEAMVMGLIGLLRWREENNSLSSVTGASRDSIGGAVWIGQEG